MKKFKDFFVRVGEIFLNICVNVYNFFVALYNFLFDKDLREFVYEELAFIRDMEEGNYEKFIEDDEKLFDDGSDDDEEPIEDDDEPIEDEDIKQPEVK